MSTATVGALRVVLGLESASFTEGLNAAQVHMAKVGKSLERVGAKMQSIGQNMSLWLTAPLAAAGAGAVKASADFESAMIAVGISTKAAAGELAKLEKAAREIGKATIFSASEAADAMDMLAKTGVSVTDILGGAAKATVDLAAAAGSELEPAASAISDAMQQFKLAAEQLPQVVNQITGAVNESKLNFDDFTLAIGQAGGVASGLGVSFQDFNAVLAATSSNFASGSDAGTSFKTFLTAMVPKSKQAAEAMAQYGLSFYDAGGQMKSMSAIAEMLRTKLGGLSQEAKSEVLTKIFGTDAMRTAIGLMEQGAAGLDEIKRKIAETDAAAQAAERMKGFNGQLEQLRGALEDLGIAIGQSGLLEFATQLVAGLSNVVDRLSETSPAVLRFATVIASVAAAVGPATIAVGTMISSVGSILTVMSRVSPAMAAATAAMAGTASGAGAMRIAFLAIGGPLGAMLGVTGLISAGLWELQKRQSGATEAQAEGARIAGALAKATDAYRVAALSAASASGAARDSALKEAAALRETAIQAQSAAREKIKLAQATVAALNAENQRAIAADRYSFRGDAAGTIKPTLNAPAVAAQQQLVAKATADLQASIRSMTDADRVLNATVPTLGKVGAAVAAAGGEVSGATKAAAKATKDFDDRLKDVLDRLMTDSERATRQAAAEIGVLREAFERGKLSAAEFHEQLARMNKEIAAKPPAAVEGLTKPWEEANRAWGEAVEERERVQAESLKRMGNSFKGFFQEWIGTGKADWKRLLLDMVNDWEGAMAALKGVGSIFSGKGGLGDVLGSMFGGGTSAGGIGSVLGKALGSAGGTLGGVINNLTGGIASAVGGVAKVFSGASGALGGAISSVTGALGGIGSAIGAALGPLVSALGPVGIIAGIGSALLKPKPSNQAALATFDGAGAYAISGGKRTSETEGAAKSAADAIQAGQEALKAFGVTLGTTVRQIDIGTRDLTHIFLSSGEELRSAVGDPAAAAETALKAVLQGATYTSDAQRSLVESMLAAGKGFDEVAAGLKNFAAAQLIPQQLGDAIAKLLDPQGFDAKSMVAEQQARRVEIEAQLKAGLLTAEQFAAIGKQLTQLDGLELGKLVAGFADAAAVEAQARVDQARAALETAYRREADAIAATIDKFKGLGTSLQAFGRKLSDMIRSYLGDTDRAAVAGDFERVAALAKLGNADAMAELQSLGEAYVAASEDSAATLEEHLAVIGKVRAAVEAAEGTASRQASIAEQQLAALDAQVAGLMTVNSSVLNVADAIANLHSAMSAADQAGRKWGLNPDANKALAAATGYAGDFGSGGWQAWILQQDEERKAIARHILDAFGQGQRIVGFAGGGSGVVGGSGGIDSQLVQMRLTPGELVDVTTPGQASTLANEIRALRAELFPALAQGTARMADIERRMRGWDGLGLPGEREVA